MEDGSNHTVNVGIKYSQKLRISKLLKYGESINKFIQEAVEVKLLNAEAELDVIGGLSE